MLLALSFSVLFLAFIPIALHLSGVRGEALPRLASGIMVLVGMLVGAGLVPRARRARRESPETFSPLIFMPAFSVLYRWIARESLRASLQRPVPIYFESSLSVFFWGLLWTLLYGCVQFARLLFVRPK